MLLVLMKAMLVVVPKGLPCAELAWPKDMDETEERDDWRLASDGCVGGPRGRHASTEALIWLTSASLRAALGSSLGLMLILIFLTGSKSSESESDVELLMLLQECLIEC